MARARRRFSALSPTDERLGFAIAVEALERITGYMTHTANTLYSGALTAWLEASRSESEALITFVYSTTKENELRYREANGASRAHFTDMLSAYLRLVRETNTANHLDDLTVVKTLMDEMKELKDIVTQGFREAAQRIAVLTTEYRAEIQELKDRQT